MKIEVGKSYKIRNGGKVNIVRKNNFSDGTHEYVGTITKGSLKGHTKYYNERGDANGKLETGYDIISDWDYPIINGNNGSAALTKREIMASIAMQGFLSNPQTDLNHKGIIDNLANKSAIAADALLNALD